VALLLKLGGKHIAHKNSIRPLLAGVFQGGKNRFSRQLKEGFIPMLIHARLTDSNYRNFSHSMPFALINCLLSSTPHYGRFFSQKLSVID
jgi:hypothetical protein